MTTVSEQDIQDMQDGMSAVATDSEQQSDNATGLTGDTNPSSPAPSSTLQGMGGRGTANATDTNVPKRIRITQEFIVYICTLYGDVYDDTKENSSIKGDDWTPGKQSEHKSLRRFREELEEQYNIKLSTTKIRKILISGGCYSTELSRSIMHEWEIYHNAAKVAEVLDISESSVWTYLPYTKTVYDLADKSDEAKSIQRWRAKKKEEQRQEIRDSVTLLSAAVRELMAEQVEEEDSLDVDSPGSDSPASDSPALDS